MYKIFEPISTILSPILTGLYEFTSDWGLAVILMTLLIRLAFSPLQLKTLRMQLIQRKMNPEMKSMRVRLKSHPEKLSKEIMALYKKYNYKPLAMISTMFVQVPVLAGVYTLFSTKGALMVSSILPWVVTFGHADPLHILPILSGLLTFTTISLPMLPEMGEVVPLLKRILPALFITPILILFMWKLPVAISLYWATGNLYALGERLFYRSPIGKRVLHKGE